MRTLEIDIRFEAGAVRIKKATGVTDRAALKDMRTMLRLLWRQPAHRHLVVEQSRPGCKRSLVDLYTAYLAGKLADLTPSFEDRELEALKDEWLAEFQVSQAHRNSCRGSFKQLLKLVRYAAKVSDVPTLLEAYRTKCVEQGTPRAFNLAKMACLALLRDKLGKRHPLRSLVADVPGMPEAKDGVLGMTVREARAIRAALTEDAARIWWIMCCTGMGPTELWGDWTALDDRVRINGTKRTGRRWGTTGREVPLLCAMTRPAMTVGHFQKLLRKTGATPYQGRKSFANWMEDAEVMRTVRRMLLGHGAKDVTDRYEKREITALLGDVRVRMLKVLGSESMLQLSKTAGLVVAPIAQEA